MKKGICNKKRKFYGVITMTGKGQIAIPIELRRELGIDQGDKLIVIKREDCQGFNLLKADTMDKFINTLSKD